MWCRCGWRSGHGARCHHHLRCSGCMTLCRRLACPPSLPPPLALLWTTAAATSLWRACRHVRLRVLMHLEQPQFGRCAISHTSVPAPDPASLHAGWDHSLHNARNGAKGVLLPRVVLQENVQRLKAYKSNLVLFPRNVKKPKVMSAPQACLSCPHPSPLRALHQEPPVRSLQRREQGSSHASTAACHSAASRSRHVATSAAAAQPSWATCAAAARRPWGQLCGTRHWNSSAAAAESEAHSGLRRPCFPCGPASASCGCVPSCSSFGDGG